MMFLAEAARFSIGFKFNDFYVNVIYYFFNKPLKFRWIDTELLYLSYLTQVVFLQLTNTFLHNLFIN